MGLETSRYILWALVSQFSTRERFMGSLGLWAGGQRACYEAAFDSKQMFIYLECSLIEVIWGA